MIYERSGIKKTTDGIVNDTVTFISCDKKEEII